MNPGEDRWRPLGHLLVESGVVTTDQIDTALDRQLRTGARLGEVLLELGFLTSADLERILMEQMGFDLSTQTGFGSGLREELARRGAGKPRPALPEGYLVDRASIGVESPRRRRLVGRKRDSVSSRGADRLRRALADFDRATQGLEANLLVLRTALPVRR